MNNNHNVFLVCKLKQSMSEIGMECHIIHSNQIINEMVEYHL